MSVRGRLGMVVLLPQPSQERSKESELCKRLPWLDQMSVFSFFGRVEFHSSWGRPVLLGAGGEFSVQENSEFPEKPLRAPAWRRSSHQTSFPLIKKVGTLDSVNSLVRTVERSCLQPFNPFLFVTFAYFVCVSYSRLWQTWNSFAETYRRITALFSNFSILS